MSNGNPITLRWLTATLLVITAPAVLAGPGFVNSARVTGDEAVSRIELQFSCKSQYVRHEPSGSSDRVRVYIDPTSICSGDSPDIVESRLRMRPHNADLAHLVDLEYNGTLQGDAMITLTFSEPVQIVMESSGLAFGMDIGIRPANDAVPSSAEARPDVLHRRVEQAPEPAPGYVINLASFQRIPTIADAPAIDLETGQKLYYYEVDIDGKTWYRLQLGSFVSADAAAAALRNLSDAPTGAWIDHEEQGVHAIELQAVKPAETVATDMGTDPVTATEVDALMEDARRAMIAGNTSQAVQIYTKVLQMNETPRHPEAQEFLALAREQNGQQAHAKAEYQRYLSLYPDSEGAARVNQRLAAMLAVNRPPQSTADGAEVVEKGPGNRFSDWRVQTYFSQYYRRDVNQPNDRDDIVSQSALYSDINIDVRRRGERFDFGSRVSLGYRRDLLDDEFRSGDQLRVSYAYVDLADAATGLSGRVGRQSGSVAGVLGRFDGVNLGYEISERWLLNAAAGSLAYSSTEGFDSARTFYGVSANFGPVWDGLEVGAFFVQQQIEGIDDRTAVGVEFRYFGEKQSIWGLVDFNTSYQQLGSGFLQGSWRLGSKLTMYGSFDQRFSPYLSTANALIGQPVFEFADLLELYSIDEIQQFALDRSPRTQTFTAGLSYSLSPRLQFSADLNETTVDETPASGGVAATPSVSYRYYATNLVASSLLKEGDVTIIGARFSDSGSAQVSSITLDSRFPINRSWRINPWLRVDRRERLTGGTVEWLYTPGLRIWYRRGQRFRMELEVGKLFSETEAVNLNLDRESYFINLGYQVFF